MKYIVIPDSVTKRIRTEYLIRFAICILLYIAAVVFLIVGKPIYADYETLNLVLMYLALAILPTLLSGSWLIFKYTARCGVVTAVDTEQITKKNIPMTKLIVSLESDKGNRFKLSMLPGPGEAYAVGDRVVRVRGTKFPYTVPAKSTDSMRCVICGQYQTPSVRRCVSCRQELVLPVTAPETTVVDAAETAEVCAPSV